MTSPTFTQSLVAGAIAGATADFIFFPVDTIKTRLQSAQGFLCAGGFRGVYQGIGSVVIGGAPSGALFFAVYNVLKQNTPLPEHLTPVTHLISGSVAEIISCVIRVPTEVVKTRSQTATFGKSPLPSLMAVRRTFEMEGLKGFYRGFGITVARDLPFTAIELPLYEIFKVQFARYLKRDSLHPREAALCGCIAGGLGAAFTTPLDVLKTRIMLDMQTDVASSTLRYQFARIRRNEGLRALFAGALPRILWMSTGGAVWFGIYEWTIHELMQRQSNIPHITSGIL